MSWFASRSFTEVFQQGEKNSRELMKSVEMES